MKILPVLVLLLSCSVASAQSLQLAKELRATSVFVRPINEALYPDAGTTIESFIAAEVNKKLFAHFLFSHRLENYHTSNHAFHDFLKQSKLVFNQMDIHRRFLPASGNSTLNTIANITGSILDTFLQQYTIQK